MFSQAKQEILQQLRTQIEEAQSVLGDLEISLGTSKETLKEYKQLKRCRVNDKKEFLNTLEYMVLNQV